MYLDNKLITWNLLLIQEWCDNGVFVFRKGKEVNICIKLPIRVEMEGRYVFIMSLI